jgi:hypothetical protein
MFCDVDTAASITPQQPTTSIAETSHEVHVGIFFIENMLEILIITTMQHNSHTSLDTIELS